MEITTIETYRKLRNEYSKVPVYREIGGDCLTPVLLLSKYAGKDNLFLLESANLDRSRGRYTFFGFNPLRTLTYKDGIMNIRHRNGGTEQVECDPSIYLQNELNGCSSPMPGAMGAFSGGLIGYLGYAFANYTGMLRKKVREAPDEPVLFMMEADEWYLFDNSTGRVFACACSGGGDVDEDYLRSRERTLAMAEEVSNTGFSRTESQQIVPALKDFSDDEFMDAVRCLQKDIDDGECLQAVLSNKYFIPGRINPVSLYRMMRNMNPSPYMFYIKGAGSVVCGTSPETHLRIKEKTAILKPIAGTIKIDDEPAVLAAKLLSDPKERAEHLMLLDLARNDLYTACDHESVKVTSFFQPETYSHVMHIVSEVEGTLCEDADPFRLFCSTFPAGTVSGGPRVRAMELIDEYEPSPRGFYAGCAGYFSYNGNMDTCIIIRSARVTSEGVTLRAGAGIVHDSRPDGELREISNKLGVLLDSLAGTSLLEENHVFAD